MPQATCRCGQRLSLPVTGPDRVICPKCSARVRIRRDAPKAGPGDGFIRFPCPCGRRLKVRADAETGVTPQAGKCPDCGRIVPVPSASAVATGSGSGSGKLKAYGPETPTEELSPDDLVELGRWASSHLSQSPLSDAGPVAATATATADAPVAVAAPPAPAPSTVKVEAGLRVCPRCGRPIHLGATACRECGAPVPKR